MEAAAQARLRNDVLPVQDLSEVAIKPQKRYTYYTDRDGPDVDYETIFEWYTKLLEVYRMFGVRARPRVAVHELGRAYDWSALNKNTQTAHFDRSMRPTFILALAAVIESQKKNHNERGTA